MKQMTPIEFFGREGAPTQTEVAKRAGIKLAAFSHYVNGRRTPSKEDAAKIAQATGEPALYAYWYPSYKQQLERMSSSGGIVSLQEPVNG